MQYLFTFHSNFIAVIINFSSLRKAIFIGKCDLRPVCWAFGLTGNILGERGAQESVLGWGSDRQFLQGSGSSGQCTGSQVGQEIFTEESSSGKKGHCTGSQGSSAVKKFLNLCVGDHHLFDLTNKL